MFTALLAPPTTIELPVAIQPELVTLAVSLQRLAAGSCGPAATWR
jgi:hypothetical protein